MHYNEPPRGGRDRGARPFPGAAEGKKASRWWEGGSPIENVTVETLDFVSTSGVAAAPAQRPLDPPARVLGRCGTPGTGPTLICVAGLHGNEPSGVEGVRRVLTNLAADESRLSGCLVGLTGNRKALAEGRRFLDRDLNRMWRTGEFERLATGARSAAEDEELEELGSELHRSIAAARDRVFLLDLHTTSGPGPAFVVYEDTLPNRRFALAFPVTLVLGIEEELRGTLADYMAELGVTTVGFESGQHEDPVAVDRAEAAVWIALRACGIVRRRAEVERARRRLAAERRGAPRVVEVQYRHPVAVDDGFRMQPGYENFQEIELDELVAGDYRGLIRSPSAGRILMPLYQEQGEDGFFIVRRVRRRWLRLSEALRRLRLERIVHWLPGVRRDPEEAFTFEVDRRVARWHTLELFHLLGFRRLAEDEHRLRMGRRHYDD